MTDLHFNPEPNNPVTLCNGYQIARFTTDGKPSIKFKCPGCDEWGNIDNDQFHGNVSIDCVDCEFHDTVNIAELIAKTRKEES